ncbi:D-mannonate oxidoreductase, partial [Streptococcus suis]
MTRDIEFKDKVVVITGAGGVLCGYYPKEFANSVAKVALLDFNEDSAQ